MFTQSDLRDADGLRQVFCWRRASTQDLSDESTVSLPESLGEPRTPLQRLTDQNINIMARHPFLQLTLIGAPSAGTYHDARRGCQLLLLIALCTNIFLHLMQRMPANTGIALCAITPATAAGGLRCRLIWIIMFLPDGFGICYHQKVLIFGRLVFYCCTVGVMKSRSVLQFSTPVKHPEPSVVSHFHPMHIVTSCCHSFSHATLKMRQEPA